MKAPAFQFYVRDWLTDTRGMPLDVKGAHIDLLAYSWAKGPLPNDEPELARILGVVVRVFRSLWRVLCRCWKLTKRGWINRRLEQTRRAQRKYRRIQAEKGKLSAASRLNRGSNRGSTAVQPERQPKFNSASALASATEDQEQDQEPAVAVTFAHGKVIDIDQPNVRVLAALVRKNGLIGESPDDSEDRKVAAARAHLAYDGSSLESARRAAVATIARRES